MKFATLALLGPAFALISGCSAIDALHTATVFDNLDSAGAISGPDASPEAVALRTGAATYTGLGVVAASDGTTATAYLGDVSMVVDFDSASVTGSVDMYRGKGNLDPTTDPEAFFDMVSADPTNFLLSMGSASGTVQMTGSVSGNGLTASVTSGALSYEGTTTKVTGGTIGAEFTGSDANGIRSTTSDITGKVNGEAADQIEFYFSAAE